MGCAAVSLSFSPESASEPAGIGRDVQEFVAQQAALRRVATLVARGVFHEELFAAVNQELAQLLRADAAALLRFESDEKITLVAAWNAAGVPVLVGEREPVNTALRRLRDTSRPRRCGPTDVPLTGPLPCRSPWR
jgi:GAF domain-containing protein